MLTLPAHLLFALALLVGAWDVGAQTLASRTPASASAARFENPVIPGFAPDPSIVRVGADFYLVTSSFEYFPAIPVYHSTDLVNWTLIGHALNDAQVAGLHRAASSGGVQAATIRHHAGVFYVVTTSIVDDQPVSFIVTARDPGGPWSPPAVIAGAEGIDPSLFFDDDGRVWYTANRLPPDPQFQGQTEIWLQELDLAAMALTGPRHALWRGCCQGVWVEAPHLFKKDGRYVLVVAEGGTSYEHAVSVAVSRQVTGPYLNNPRNPVLTHRHLSLDHPITSVGHADLVELADGRWYAVVLGTRRLAGEHPTLGRETFLVPVRWETEREWWKEDKLTVPVFSPDSGRVESSYPVPFPGTRQHRVLRIDDDFRGPQLSPEWSLRRAPERLFHSLTDAPGHLRLHLQPETFAERAQVSFLGIRQRHLDFSASVRMRFRPTGRAEAGLVVVQKDTAAFALTLAAGVDGRTVLRLTQFGEAGPRRVAERRFDGEAVWLRVTGRGLDYRFEASPDGRRWSAIGPALDGRALSPAVLKGFNYTGVFTGVYGSTHGEQAPQHADFSVFRYRGR